MDQVEMAAVEGGDMKLVVAVRKGQMEQRAVVVNLVVMEIFCL